MKICVRCASENGDDYKYCKFCGTELPCIDSKPQRGYDENFGDFGQRVAKEKNEISVFEMETFVGKNQKEIIPKFVTMQKSGRKAGFSLPVFLFGFFFGYFGTAVWFLYRKMNKAAAAILSFGIVAKIIETVVNFKSSTMLYRNIFIAFGELLSSVGLGDNQGAQTFANRIMQAAELYSQSSNDFVYTVLNNIGYLVFPIVFGILGLYIYKKHSVKTILSLKNKDLVEAEYIVRLSKSGGVSVGRVFIGLLIYIGVVFIIDTIPLIAAFAGI